MGGCVAETNCVNTAPRTSAVNPHLVVGGDAAAVAAGGHPVIARGWGFAVLEGVVVG